MIYTTGTIAGSGNTITGTGTNFTAAGSLIRAGCTLIAFTNPVQVLQLTAITNGTSLSVTPAISPTIAAGTKYAILLSDSLSVDGLAQDIAETFGMYQKYMGGFSDVMNGTGDVTITINGQAVTVPGQKSLAKKGANSDITSLNGLTTALSITQGGTGAKDAAGARSGFGLGNAATKDTGTAAGQVMQVGAFGLGVNMDIATGTTQLHIGSPQTNITRFGYVPSSVAIGFLPGEWRAGFEIKSSGVTGFQLWGSAFSAAPRVAIRCANPSATGYTDFVELYTTMNTTKATDGTLKSASPVIQLFADGRAETNQESDGCIITRQDVGEYLIEGCVGLNADAAWGGIDGGFDIPTDRNRQSLVWLDYAVNADGSILVKTYHRTHPDAPAFARNIRDGYENGDPIDIPADQFVSVRVEMPEGSIYNQKQQAAAQKAMEEAERIAAEKAKEEADRAATEPNQPESE